MSTALAIRNLPQRRPPSRQTTRPATVPTRTFRPKAQATPVTAQEALLAAQARWQQAQDQRVRFLGPPVRVVATYGRSGLSGFGAVASTDATKSTAITDAQGGVWTLGPTNETLLNGVHMANGRGTIYKYLGGVVYVLGGDNNWYEWSGSSWIALGPSEPQGSASSPDGTKAVTITDAEGGVWTIGSAGETLRNGVHMSQGYGSIYKWLNGVVYVLGGADWYQWYGSYWSLVGPEPGVSVSSPRDIALAAVRALYLEYFNRDPLVYNPANGSTGYDEAGLNYWTDGYLANGEAAVRAAFEASIEETTGTNPYTAPPVTTQPPVTQSPPPTTQQAPGATSGVLDGLRQTWANLSTPVKIGGAVLIGLMVFGGGGSSSKRR